MSPKKVPPPIPVIGAGQAAGGQSREEELRAWEENQRQLRTQQAAAAVQPVLATVPAPTAAPGLTVAVTPKTAPEAPVQPTAAEPAAVVVREETPGYLPMPEFAEPDSTDPAERLAFYSRGILAVQYAARANHERAEQQKLIGLGLRLKAMKEEELHKVAGFDTFGDFTLDRFGIKKHQANNIIRVTPVAQALEDITTQELKERPLRVLVPVLEAHGAQAVRETWEEAARHGNVTDKTLLAAANFLGYGPPKELPSALEKEPKEGGEKPAGRAGDALGDVERIRSLAETDPAQARREAEELESAVRELLEELAGNLE